MELFLYIVSGVLAVLTAGFVAVAIKVVLHQKASGGQDQERFSYTQNALTGISGGVDALHGKVDTALIPRLDAVYGKLTDESRVTKAAELLDVLKGLGFDFVPATSNNTLFFMGVGHGGLKISFFVGWNMAEATIGFRTFSFAVDELSADAANALLLLNTLAPMASVGVQELGKKKVVVADYLLPITGGSIQGSVINRVMWTLADRHRYVAVLLKRFDVAHHECLINEYLDELPIDPATGVRVLSIGSSVQQLQAWLAPSPAIVP